MYYFFCVPLTRSSIITMWSLSDLPEFRVCSLVSIVSSFLHFNGPSTARTLGSPEEHPWSVTVKYSRRKLLRRSSMNPFQLFPLPRATMSLGNETWKVVFLLKFSSSLSFSFFFFFFFFFFCYVFFLFFFFQFIYFLFNLREVQRKYQNQEHLKKHESLLVTIFLLFFILIWYWKSFQILIKLMN